jgi:hypothetical protein
METLIINEDTFIHKGLLYSRDRKSGYCFAQKDFRGPLRRIRKSDFLSACQEVAIVRAERTNAECEKTLGKVKA